MQALFGIFIASFLLSSHAFSSETRNALPENGNWAGNGGIIIECQEAEAGKGPSYHLWDLLEAGIRSETLGLPEGPVGEKVFRILQRIRPFDADRSDRYARFAKKLFEKMAFIGGMGLTRDTDLSQVPKNCRALQGAIQFLQIPIETGLFLFNDDLWEVLNDDQKVSLLVHEILYLEANFLGHEKDSSFVRSYTRALLTDSFKGMTQDQYLAFMASLQLAEVRWTDPVSGKIWLLNSASDRNNLLFADTCYELNGGRLPTRTEFMEAAPFLFATQEAQLLGLADEHLFFWVLFEDRIHPSPLNRMGQVYIKFQTRISNLCVSDR